MRCQDWVPPEIAVGTGGALAEKQKCRRKGARGRHTLAGGMHPGRADTVGPGENEEEPSHVLLVGRG